MLTHVSINFKDVFFQIFRRRLSLWPSICSVIPSEHIDVFFKEHLDVVGMRNVHHLLVKHCIWVANNEARPSQVKFELARLIGRINDRTTPVRIGACGAEEHAVKLAVVFSFYPMVLSIELSFQDHAELLDLTKKNGVLATAWGSSLLTTTATSETIRPWTALGSTSKDLN